MRLPSSGTPFRGTPCLVFLISLTFCHPATLRAQFTSVLEGRITDPSDAPVPNAEVTVEHAGTGVKRVVRTSEVGYYRVAPRASHPFRRAPPSLPRWVPAHRT